MTRSGAARLWLRPELLALHLLAIVAVVVCIAGGLWQFGAYDTRQADERADRQEVPTVPIEQVWSPGDPFGPGLNHRPVTVRGTFGPVDEQVWVSGRVQDGRDGFWLLAPLEIADGDALLVVRGFSPEATDVPTAPAGPQEFEVVLEPGEGSAAPLDDRGVIGSVRVPTLVNEVPYRLFPGFGISTDVAVAGDLSVADPPAPDVAWTVGLRNLAYSLQWWVFGLFAAFMWWRMCSENVAAARARAAANDQEKELV